MKVVSCKGSDFMGHILADISISILSSLMSTNVCRGLLQVWRSCTRGSEHSWHQVKANTAKVFLKVNLVWLLEHITEIHTPHPTFWKRRSVDSTFSKGGEFRLFDDRKTNCDISLTLNGTRCSLLPTPFFGLSSHNYPSILPLTFPTWVFAAHPFWLSDTERSENSEQKSYNYSNNCHVF